MDRIETGRSPVVGIGASPVGLQLNLARESGSALFVNGSAGVVAFTREVPVPDARKLNFAVDFGGGVRVSIRKHLLAFGWKYHHISNAGTGHVNPGVDGNIFFVGVTRARRHDSAPLRTVDVSDRQMASADDHEQVDVPRSAIQVAFPLPDALARWFERSESPGLLPIYGLPRSTRYV